MPKIYLSPSTQEANLYVNGGTEEFYMNQIADAMEPFLVSNGIRFTRNTPQMTAASSIRQSKQDYYDFYLALHSNAAPEGRYGEIQGTDVYYYPTSTNGRRAAEIIANNLKEIYPNPSLVRTVSTTRLGEVRQPTPPSVLIEFAYHDNVEDATWIKNNINAIAQNVVKSLTEYFDIPFVPAQVPRRAVVATQSTALNIRSKPETTAPIIARAPKGASITVVGRYNDWYVVNYGNISGYAKSEFIDLI